MSERIKFCVRVAAIAAVFVIACLVTAKARADAGILLPHGQNQPNPAVLSLEDMEITIQIDNGDARVFIKQIFANHTAAIEEGTYVLALPTDATVSDFAVWDGPDANSRGDFGAQARPTNI